MVEEAALLARLASAESGNIDVKELLDAVVLASAWARWDQGNASSASVDAAGDAERNDKPDQADSTDGHRDRAEASGRTTGTTRDTAASVWLEDQAGSQAINGKRVSVGRSPALPDALDIGRALRPLRRPWLSGVHQHLDVDATVEYYTRTGTLVPRLTSAPEPWLEVIVVLDRGTAMAVWDETIRTLTKTLRALAAFRDVRIWHLEHPPGEDPVLHDHHGSVLPLDPGTARHTQPARRLLLVVTDCAAPAWRRDTLWKTLHAWGRTAPVALINPLPKRLWQRSGLDLPHTTAAATVPASPGRLLSYRRPRLLRETQDTKPWQALPVLQFDPAQILAWARTLMRMDPSGCEAVLVPATGRPPLRRRHPGPSGQPVPAPTDEQVRARAEAFADERESPAVRLAIAACPLDSFTLPVLDVLRDRLVPDATLADTAEFLTAGLLTATRNESADTVYQFHSAAADHLTSLLTRDQLWDTHFALSDHLATRLQAPHGIPVILRSAHADETLASSIRPIAYAAATTARLLGVEARDRLPKDRSLSAFGPTAQVQGEINRRLAPATPKSPEGIQRGKLYGTLAQLFRSLLDKASMYKSAARPSEPMHPRSRVENESGRRQGRDQATGDSREIDLMSTKLVIAVDTAASGTYSDVAALEMRSRMYRVLETALEYADVPRGAVHMEDRGDGVIIAVDGHIPPTRLVGPWVINVYEELRYDNRRRRTPLKLRIGMHDGPVLRDQMGIVGSAANHASRLIDSSIARQLLSAEEVDLLVVASQSLYEGVIRNGGSFIDPALYSSARLQLKQGGVIAWFHIPGHPAPSIPPALAQRRRPDELGLIVQDLTLLLGNVTVALENGRYPDRESGKKVAGLLRAVADQFDVYGASTSLRDAMHQHSPFHPEGGVTHDALAAGVASACRELFGATVAGESDVEMSGLWTLNGMELPAGLTDATIDDITPDMGSIVWSIMEEREGGLILGRLKVDARLVLEGFMHKGDYSDSGDVDLLWEVSDHMVEVSFEGDVQLIFDGKVDSGNIDLEFRGFESSELYPHAEVQLRDTEGQVTQSVTTTWNQGSGSMFSGSSVYAQDANDGRRNGG
ncbi:SAV_2336 N-terminal domain-related protein [Streptomyces sp. NRRL B-24572]|uniref:SAV_2336 N-terminal domain-related protein n=1 Tax=Streptomyces sp. NRRL B-24572 TaxID=1962156 RepID=UPI001180C19B|nr:SAV_2336 N-terminal domain-related protein [Streptomyces sp. NRRL B-24572]